MTLDWLTIDSTFPQVGTKWDIFSDCWKCNKSNCLKQHLPIVIDGDKSRYLTKRNVPEVGFYKYLGILLVWGKMNQWQQTKQRKDKSSQILEV